MSDKNITGIYWHNNTLKALEKLKTDPGSPVWDKSTNFILNWAVMNVHITREIEKLLEEYLPPAQIARVKARYPKYAGTS